MNLPEMKNSELVVFRPKDGTTEFQVVLDGSNDTVWATEQQIMELFGKARRTIGEHIKNIYKEGELDKESTWREFRQVQKEGYPRLLELMYANLVGFYKNYYWNSGNATQDVSLELFNEKNEKYSIGIFNSKKGKLKKFSKGKEKTFSFVKENKMSDENIIAALKLYEIELKVRN